MRYVVYFVPREGVHPCVSLDLYKKLWPIMHESVRRIGHRLVHLTDLHTECWGDDVFRVDVSSETTVYSRDVAWLKYVESLPDGEEACMIEPDTYMKKDIPSIAKGFDMVLLRRPESCVPGWFKLAKNTAAPFYREVVRMYDSMPLELRVFHGDIGAMHRTLGFKDGEKAHTIPGECCGVKIEVRDWPRYGFRKANNDPFFLQFKGTSKMDMLALAP